MTLRTARPDILPNPYTVLRDHGLRAKKALGQNFLTDPNIPRQIASSGGVRTGDVIFEIGAGCGTLTHCLSDLAERVIALEYDEDLAPIAREELAYAPHVEIRHGDIRKLDWAALAEEIGQELVVYGNLPYYLSSEILLALLASPQSWRRACFLVQLEFAERVCAPPGNRAAGSISALAHLLSYPSLLFQVKPEAFSPPPKVTSAVMVLEKRDDFAEDVGDLKTFRAVVKALFAQRRKMARSTLKPLHDDPTALLQSLNLTPTHRGERFTLEEIARISRALFQMKSV